MDSLHILLFLWFGWLLFGLVVFTMSLNCVNSVGVVEINKIKLFIYLCGLVLLRCFAFWLLVLVCSMWLVHCVVFA